MEVNQMLAGKSEVIHKVNHGGKSYRTGKSEVNHKVNHGGKS